MLPDTTVQKPPTIPALEPTELFSFTRYLGAKKSVDDRSLNRQVWDSLARSLPSATLETPVHILEVGAGTGTMIERVLERDLVRYACYTAVDSSAENIQAAFARLEAWARGRRLQFELSNWAVCLRGEGLQVQVIFEQENLHDFIASRSGARCWDLLLAHHFLDLIDVPAVLPGLFKLLKPQGKFLASMNFDGVSILEPAIDPNLDEMVMRLYHRTMDERLVNGKPFGDSRTGRHLFQHIKSAGAEVLSAGASDWVIFAGPHGYPGEDAYFLRYILYTIQQALSGHPELDAAEFAGWIHERNAQIDRGELVYIAHQLDFFGRLSPEKQAPGVTEAGS